MKKIIYKIAGTFGIFVVLLLIGLGVLKCIPYKQDENLNSEIHIENVKQSLHLPVSVRYFTKMPGKYDEVSINIKLTSKEDLTILAKDFKYEGIEYKTSDNGLSLTNVKFRDSNAKIYIPAGTTISESGYKLGKDYVVMDLTIITSVSEYFSIFFKQIYLVIIIAFLVSLINLIPWHPVEDLDFNKGVLHMAILIPCAIFGGGAFGLISDQIGRGTYSNDRALIIMMSIFVIPLGIIGLYAVLTTIVHNIASCGIFLGILITFVQLLLVMSVLYVGGLIIFTMIAGTKSIMNQKRYY